MGSRSHPHRVLSVCVCVSRCLWVCVIEADSLQLRVITVGLYLFLSRSLLCQILAVLRSSFTVRSGSAIPEPCCFLDSDHRTFGCPLLPCATRVCPTESSVSAYGKLRLCPTESSVSAYGKLRFCLRKAPPLPYGKLRFCLRKAPPLPYGELRFCLRKAPPLPYGKLRFCLRKAPPLPYGKLRFCLRKAPPLSTKSSTFSSRCVLLLVINSLFRN